MAANRKNEHFEFMDIRPQMPMLAFEAESIAYVVCQHFGIDTSDYSFAYVTGWIRDKELPELKASLDCISSTAAEMITAIEAACPTLARTPITPQVKDCKTQVLEK